MSQSNERHPMPGNRMDAEAETGEHGFETHDYDVVVVGAGGESQNAR